MFADSTRYDIEKLNKSHQQMQRNQSEIQTKYEKEREDANNKMVQMQKKIESKIKKKINDSIIEFKLIPFHFNGFLLPPWCFLIKTLNL